MRFGIIAIAIAAICGVFWGFQTEKISRLGLIFLGVCTIYATLSVFLPERIIRRRISRRQKLPFHEIYHMHFQQLPYSHDLVEHVWNELANDFKFDAGKLRPTDRFGVEFSAKGFPLVDLNEMMNARLKERLRTAKTGSEEAKKASSIKTVFDYVEFICAIECKHMSEP